MKKYEILKKVEKEKMVAIVRVKDAKIAEPVVDSLVNGGIECIEVTFTVPFIHSTFEHIAKKYQGTNVCLGAGSILDSETARIAIICGAEFLVTPTFNEDVVKLANRYGIPTFAGIMTPTEALKAKECGVDVVKLYPANQFKYSIVKDLRGPIPTLAVMPTGGVDLNNIKDWIKAGAFACGVGGSLTKGAKDGDFELITKTAKDFKKAIEEACENE